MEIVKRLKDGLGPGGWRLNRLILRIFRTVGNYFIKYQTGKYIITHLFKLTEYRTPGVPDANVASASSFVKHLPFW